MIQTLLRHILTVVVLSGVPGQQAMAQDRVLPRAPYAHLIGTRQVSFVAPQPDGICSLAQSDLQTAHAPWSTFKIPNLLIALETGVAADLDARRIWDARRYPPGGFGPKVWFQDHTLASAFRTSAVWYFREVARDVGTARYRAYLSAWRYGTAEVREGSDRFWLNEGLEISASGQVAFLSDLLSGTLGVSDRSRDALAQAALARRAGRFALYGKTGAGPIQSPDQGRRVEGWYVGWVEDGQGAIPFALYAQAESYPALRDFRKAFAVRLLQGCGLLPAGF